MKKYFSDKVSSGFLSIYSSRIIARIGGGLIGLFFPIFMYQLFDFNINYLILYYLIDYSIFATFTVAGAKLALNKLGIKKSIIVSTIWIVAFYYIFFLIDKNTIGGDWLYNNNRSLIFFLLMLSIIVLNFRRWMFWVPLHTDLIEFTKGKDRAKELSFLEATAMLTGMFLPILSGWVITNYNYEILFALAMVLFFASAIPLFRLPETKEKFSWGYKRTFKELFSKKRRKMVIAIAGDGAENMIGTIMWPVFMWELLKGNYMELGIISSLIVIVSIILQLTVGKLVDLHPKKEKKLLRIGTVLYALGWIVKIFISTSFQVFVVSAYHNLAKIFTRAPFDTLTYERAADQGHFVDEYTVVRELALSMGRLITMVFLLIFVPIVGIKWSFILGAIATLLMNFLTEDKDTIEEKGYNV